VVLSWQTPLRRHQAQRQGFGRWIRRSSTSRLVRGLGHPFWLIILSLLVVALAVLI
jgi:hypothetical protein